jgi:hypothetical protein
VDLLGNHALRFGDAGHRFERQSVVHQSQRTLVAKDRRWLCRLVRTAYASETAIPAPTRCADEFRPRPAVSSKCS